MRVFVPESVYHWRHQKKPSSSFLGSCESAPSFCSVRGLSKAVPTLLAVLSSAVMCDVFRVCRNDCECLRLSCFFLRICAALLGPRPSAGPLSFLWINSSGKLFFKQGLLAQTRVRRPQTLQMKFFHSWIYERKRVWSDSWGNGYGVYVLFLGLSVKCLRFFGLCEKVLPFIRGRPKTQILPFGSPLPVLLGGCLQARNVASLHR